MSDSKPQTFMFADDGSVPNNPALPFVIYRHAIDLIGSPDPEPIIEKRFRENGWSLFGLARSLEDQGRVDEAHDGWARFAQAWRRADVVLTSSRILSTTRQPVRPEPSLGRQ